MKIDFIEVAFPKTGGLVVFSFDDGPFSGFAKQVDEAGNGQLTRAAKLGKYNGRFGQHVMVVAPVGIEASYLLLVGLGKADELDALKARKIGGKLITEFLAQGETAVAIAVDAAQSSSLNAANLAANITFGACLRHHRFEKYRTGQRRYRKSTVDTLQAMTEMPLETEQSFTPMREVAMGVLLTRDLVTEPGNVIYPESYIEQIDALRDLGVEIEVLGANEMRQQGMGALLGVAQGSEREPQLAVMHWRGGAAEEAPVAFVGKGVTFDSGGISLKAVKGMEEMKYDMAGSAVVVGLMKALAGRKAKVNVVGVVGLVENMPSGRAQRPGDVVTSMSGQTIEVINTDCEGRLVLADALWYTQHTYRPRCMIDLATLTYAVIAALGSEFAGVFSNDDGLVQALTEAGRAVGEPVWRLPLTQRFDKMIDSEIADMKNCSDRPGDAIMAAQFLQRFVNGVPWVHIDIAGTAWKRESSNLARKGATGYGVQLLNQFVLDNFE